MMKFLLFLPLLSNAFFTFHNIYNHRRSSLHSNPMREPGLSRKYPLSRNYHEHYLKRLNSRNITIQINEILNNNDDDGEEDQNGDDEEDDGSVYSILNIPKHPDELGYRVVLNKKMFERISHDIEENFKPKEDEYEKSDQNEYYDTLGNKLRSFGRNKKNAKSENFEVISKSPVNFSHVGGYANIKSELYQCLDILSNYTKYQKYNVRVPKGLIFEGPPGNGKTLIAKALAGEAGINFIPVSGSEFQDKYIGVGSARIRELFKLAKENIPCIVFIDEIDALGRKRSSDGESSGNERDATLNQLLIELDGFKDTSGVFLIGATNRVDLLDTALIRPGRIDKRIYIGNPDSITRKAILDIHSQGKPHDDSVITDNLVEVTSGLSSSQIENLLNEAMLNALRCDKTQFTSDDLDEVLNKMMVGWQPSDHEFTSDIIEQIAVHELGHAVVGICSIHHSKMKKVVINLSSPNSPAYTIFENNNSNFFTREALLEHLMILLAGRVAEEVFYGMSVTTGAINDFEEALKLAQKMVCYYGMGDKLIYPTLSEKYKEIIDTEVANLIQDAYKYGEYIIRNSKDLIMEGVEILLRDKVLKEETLSDLVKSKYNNSLNAYHITSPVKKAVYKKI